MSKYSESQIREIVSELLSKGHEGDNWDYKREWPSSEENTDLIKDIISFANTAHSKDCFIIYGANNDGQPYLMQHKRKNQNELLGILSNVPSWAGNNQPQVSLESITICGNDYDVIIVYNSNRTPFYLQEDCIPKINFPKGATQEEKKEIYKKIDKKTLHKGIIYARTGDNTTPFNGNANPFVIENLWKKRFNLFQPVYEQFINEMNIVQNWYSTDGKRYFNIYRPEFTFQHKEDDKIIYYSEFFVKLFGNTKAYSNTYVCNYFGTPLHEVNTISIDGCRWYIPYPNVSNIPFNNKRYFYIVDKSEDKIYYNFLNAYNVNNINAYLKRYTEYVPYFHNNDERQYFEQWLQNKDNQETFNKKYNLNLKKESLFSIQEEKIDATNGKTLVEMLEYFRE